MLEEIRPNLEVWKKYDKVENHFFGNGGGFKLEISMIAQNDRNRILSNFVLLQIFPGCIITKKLIFDLYFWDIGRDHIKGQAPPFA